jgi:hypothetical protein
MAWKKSTFSGDSSCVEVFRKSTFSGTGGSCVDVARTEGSGARVRDTKLGDASPVLEFTEDEWAAFVRGVKAGEFGDYDPADSPA